MHYNHAYLRSIGYELAPNVVATATLERRLAPLYEKLNMSVGQVETLTGIRERRYWNRGQTMSGGATRAGRKALAESGLPADQIDILIFAGVCRDHLEPATACAVADGLGLGGQTEIYDVSNACLGVLNGMVVIADAIETGRARAGMVVSCETARPIVDLTIERMLEKPDMDTFRASVATLTGGSGAIALVLSGAPRPNGGHRLAGGVIRSDARYHDLCRWGPDPENPNQAPTLMETSAAAVLDKGVALGARTWRDFLAELDWPAESIDRLICHQVGAAHRDAILRALEFPAERDFSTFEYLGNIGTVSLPITAAIADQRGVLARGQRVAFAGIGSGLNCLVLGLEW